MKFNKEHLILKNAYWQWRQQLEFNTDQERKTDRFYDSRKDGLLPNSCFYIFNLASNSISHSANTKLLTGGEFQIEDHNVINKKYHENQAHLIYYDTYSLFASCQDFLNPDFYFFSQRAMKTFGGDYWLVHQHSFPLLFDSKKRLLNYICYITFIKPFVGEPYKSYVGLTLDGNSNGIRRNSLIESFNKSKVNAISIFEPDIIKSKVLLECLIGNSNAQVLQDKYKLKEAEPGNWKKEWRRKLNALYPDLDNIVTNPETTYQYLREMFNITKMKTPGTKRRQKQ